MTSKRRRAFLVDPKVEYFPSWKIPGTVTNVVDTLEGGHGFTFNITSAVTRPYKAGFAYLFSGYSPEGENADIEFWRSGGQLLVRLWVGDQVRNLGEYELTVPVVPRTAALWVDNLVSKMVEDVEAETPSETLGYRDILQGLFPKESTMTVEGLEKALTPEELKGLKELCESSRRRRGRALPRGWTTGEDVVDK